MADSVVVFSGGPDSTAAALWGLDQGYSLELLTFQLKGLAQYGELRSAIQVAGLIGLPHKVVDLKCLMELFGHVHILMHAGTSSRGSSSTRLSFGAGVILSIAAAYANQSGASRVIWGATRDDSFGGNYEYTQEFANQLAALASKTCGRAIEIQVPFASQHKFETMAWFASKPAIFAATWSCKDASSKQCGTCHACVARRVSAAAARLTDTSSYSSSAYTSPLTAAQLAHPASVPAATWSPTLQSE